MLVLGIETSCDDTAVSVVADGHKILSNVVSSQIRVHRKYSGVVPELASRKHLENISWVIKQALDSISLAKIDAIAVTQGPGLIGSLLVGVETAKALAYVYKVPLVPVNHIEGHIFANFLERESRLQPPFIALVVSGGHSDLIYVKDFFEYKVLGQTRDDAVGEAFDKVAKLLNLGYPGGPVIDKLSYRGNPTAIKFPRPYLPGSWDFSFSGLKTAVVNYVRAHPPRPRRGMNTAVHPYGRGRRPGPTMRRGECRPIFGGQATVPGSQGTADVVASFQAAVIDVLVKKVFLAAERCHTERIVLGGGVAANSHLRRELKSRQKKSGIKVHFPPKKLCTDNGAMIACAGWYKLKLKSEIRNLRRSPYTPDSYGVIGPKSEIRNLSLDASANLNLA